MKNISRNFRLLTQSRHGDECPPEASGNRVESSSEGITAVLGVVNCRGENDNTDTQKEKQEKQLLHATKKNKKYFYIDQNENYDGVNLPKSKILK